MLRRVHSPLLPLAGEEVCRRAFLPFFCSLRSGAVPFPPFRAVAIRGARSFVPLFFRSVQAVSSPSFFPTFFLSQRRILFLPKILAAARFSFSFPGRRTPGMVPLPPFFLQSCKQGWPSYTPRREYVMRSTSHLPLSSSSQ